jgi:NAD(P)-dependent dehydrogenase (short-subunit alcohol dehydrogenase family)
VLRVPGCVAITGASGAVGRAVAHALSQYETLALLDRAEPHHELPPSARFASYAGVDLTDEVAVDAAFARVRSELGPMRALVHTAGGFAAGQVGEQGAAALRQLFETNLITAANAVRAALPDLLAAEEGRIVLFGSAQSLRGRAGASAYAAAKGGLLRYAEALAEEVTGRGVSVVVLLPTTIDTPVNRAAMPDARVADWVTPDQIASTVAFLLGPAAAGIRFAAIPMGR